MPTCALCKGEKELRNSHIISEFFYKPLYDDKHRFNVVPLSDDQKMSFEQKGLREQLLCDDCESRLSRYEKYTRGIFYGGVGINIKNSNPIEISGIDYQQFKLFQLSLIYRASVSRLDFFKNVSLGPHEEKIRRLLLEENPGSKFDYPCMIIMFVMEKNEILDGLIFPPQMLKIEGHRTFRFILGGGFWVYFISSHARQVRFPEFYLSEQGKVLIPLREAEKTDFFLQLAKDVIKK